VKGKRSRVNRKDFSSPMPAEGFVREPVVLAHVGLGRSTLWLRVKQGSFPQPVKLSARITAWPVKAIREWMDAQLCSDQKAR
jgi:prophage regulatory protein